MNAKTKRGKDFAGVLRYAFEGSAPGRDAKRATIIASTLAGSNVRSLADEFRRVAALRPDIEKPVWKWSLALPAGEE